jgi:hypothetical protein
MTFTEACNPNNRLFHHVFLKNADKTPLCVRRNGKTQVWKTRPGEFRLPVKYGLRDTFQITNKNAHEWVVARNVISYPSEGDL